MIAHQCGLEVGEFVHTLGDAHIYLNHLDQIKEQLSRPVHQAPQLILPAEAKPIDEYQIDVYKRQALMRSMRAIDDSDVVLVVLNAEEGIRELDKHIAGYAHEAGRAVIIVVNKWDTIPDRDQRTMTDFTNLIRHEFQYLSYAPIVFVSAKTKQRLSRLPEMIEEAYDCLLYTSRCV